MLTKIILIRKLSLRATKSIIGIRPNLPPPSDIIFKNRKGVSWKYIPKNFPVPCLKLIVFRCLFKECEEIFLRQFLLLLLRFENRLWFAFLRGAFRHLICRLRPLEYWVRFLDNFRFLDVICLLKIFHFLPLTSKIHHLFEKSSKSPKTKGGVS